jgi:hypothetical protein
MAPPKQLYTMEQSLWTAPGRGIRQRWGCAKRDSHVLADPLFCSCTVPEKAFQRAEDGPNGMPIRLDSRSMESTGSIIASEFEC